MPWSFTIGRFGGVPVRIHVTFLLLLAWIAFSAFGRGGANAAIDSTLFIVLIFACVVLHEFGHIFAARRYGIGTSEVTLLPIGGVSSLQRLPSDPRQELVVALAGPAVNLVIALVLIAVTGAIHAQDLDIDDFKASLAGRLAAANLFLALFNLIPAFPMDGGRVLHALVAMRVGPVKATDIAARIGQAFAIALGFLGLFGNPLLVFVAIFVYIAAAAEAQMSAAHQSLKGLSVGEAMETRFTPIPIEATLGQAVDALLATAQHEFPVVDAFRKPAGLLTREDILAAVRKHGGEEPASAFMRSGVESVRPSAPVDSVLERMQAPGAAALYVTDRDGAIVGLLTRQALADAVLIRSVRPDWRFERHA
jgi:Zn-dependent protease